jgi:LPXTG-motif cell wall-anchored protein
LEDKSSKQDKTNNNLKTAKLMSTNVKEEDGTKEDNVAKALGGNDVNDKIKTSNVKFTDGTWKKGSLNQIGFDLQIPEDVKRNDYFSVKVPKELNPTSADRDNGILLGNDENSIYAKGIYNRENNAFDFKFTDNVEKYKNKTSHVDLMALINFKEATKTDNYNLNLQVGNQTFTENRKIEYTTDARNTMVYQDSSIEEKDGDHNPYNTTYTINGQSKSLNGSKVKITPYTGSSKSADTISKFDPKTTTVSVVKVNDKNTMNQSGSDKNVNGTDESSKHKITYNSDGSMTIDLGNITGPYLIKVNSQTERPFVPNTFVGSTVELSASNIATQSTQSKIGKAKASDSNSSGVIVDDTTPPTVAPINDQTKDLNTPIDPVVINSSDNSGKPVKNDVYGLPEGVTFDSETNTISGTPAKPGTYNVTVLSSDHVYNETTTEFTIKVEDATPPAVDPINNQTKEVNTPINPITINASDNSDKPVKHTVDGLPEGVTFDSETNTISGTPTKVGTSTVTVTSRDESGNETTTNFDIKVEDTTAPDVEDVDDQTKEVNTPIDDIKLNGTDNSKGKVTHEVSGLPEGVTFDSETNTISGTPTKVGTSTVTVTSRDESGNETTTNFDLKVEDTTGPDVEDVDDQTKEVNTPIDDIKLNGTDNSKGKVTHEVSGLPEGVTFDSETNTISGTPTKVGTSTITVTSRDESGNETTTNFDLKVEDTTAPDVEDVDNQTKEVNTPIDDIKLNGTDNSKGKVTHTVDGLPEGVTFDSETNTISGTPTKVGTSTVTVTSRDESGNETTTNFDLKVEDTTAPDVEDVDDQTKEVNTPIDDIKLNGTDNSKGKVTHEVSGLPEGVTFDSETNTISGTPTKVGNYPVTVTSRDEQGNETTTNFDIKVEDTTGPDVEAVDDQTKEVNTPIDDIKLNGTDNSKGKVTHTVDGLPEGVTFDSETNTISGTPTKVGTSTVTVTSRDEEGNETTTSFTITVEDTTKPTVDNISDQTKEINTGIDPIKIHATDNSGQPVKNTVTGLPEGVTFNPETNTISGTPTKVGNYPVTVTSRDEQGNETTTTFTITVQDTTKPTVDNISDQTKEVNTSIDPIEIQATDNSGQPVKNTVTGLPEGVTFDPETNTISGTPTKVGSYKIIVISTDEAGNSIETSFVINVEDNTPVSGKDDNDIPNPNSDDNNSSTNGSEDNSTTSTTDGDDNAASHVNNSNNVTSKHNDSNVSTFSDENRDEFERNTDDTMSDGTLITSNYDNHDDSKSKTNSEVTSDKTQNNDERNNDHQKNTEKSLPDTGQNDKNLTLLGSLMALFGAALLGRKKKKDNKNQ